MLTFTVIASAALAALYVLYRLRKTDMEVPDNVERALSKDQLNALPSIETEEAPLV